MAQALVAPKHFQAKWPLRQAQDEAGSREGNATKNNLSLPLYFNPRAAISIRAAAP